MINFLNIFASFVAGALCSLLFIKWLFQQALRDEVLRQLHIHKAIVKHLGEFEADRKEIKNLLKADELLQKFFIASGVVTIIYIALILAILIRVTA